MKEINIYREQEFAERAAFLQSLINEKKKALLHVPEGRIKGNRHREGWQYYVRMDPKEKNGKYIPKDQSGYAKVLGQKEYDRRVLETAQTELFHLERLCAVQNKGLAENVLENLPQSIQPLVTPIEQPIDQYVQEWLRTPYQGLGFDEDSPDYYSEKEERMRSKSEVIIANLLLKYDVPYLYEKPLYLNGMGYVHPDFTLLSRRTREEKYLEHLGMLDNPDYVEKCFRKIACYEQNGLFLGERVFVTYETSKQPLNMRLLEKKISHIAIQL